MVRAVLLAIVLIAAPSKAGVLDIVLYNLSDKPVRLGGSTGPQAAVGKSARYALGPDATDLVIYEPATRCAYHYMFSTEASGYPWRQNPAEPFKLQLGRITDLALLSQDATGPMRPRPRQPGGFPLLPPRVQCTSK